MAGPVLVVGAGAAGGYIAAHLERAGEEVVVWEPWAPNAKAVAARGLTLVEPAGRFQATPRVVPSPAEAVAAAPRLTILCTKLSGADEAVETLEAAGHRAPYLVTLNALADFEMARRLGAERVMGCIVTGLFAHLVAPGELHRHRRRGEGAPSFRLGEVTGGLTPRLAEATALLAKVDLSEAVPDLAAARWSKLVFNCMTSPLSAAHSCAIRDLFLDETLRAQMVEVALEVVRAAMAADVTLDPVCGASRDAWEDAARGDASPALDAALVRYGEKLDPKAVSGMAQDLARGRRTEVALINGAAVREAARHGLSAPRNAALVARIEALSAG
jgi:2-dehydropantoate 2-reductase